jgi:hypothetical protein
MTRMATTGTSTDVTTPMRETVGGQNHPLGAAGPPASPFVAIDSPSSPEEAGVPALGPSTRSNTRAPAGNTLERDAADEIEETQGEDLSDGAGLSEQDEALSDDDSSFGDDSQAMGPPNLQELVQLGQEHYRTPCRVRNQDGVQVAGICGKKNEGCQRHAVKRSGAKNYQYAAGSYPRIAVARGFTGHGLANRTVYSDAQLDAFKVGEAEEMETLVQTMIEGAEYTNEMEELARDLRVHFKASETHQAEKAQPGKTPAKEDVTNGLRKALAAKTAGPKIPKGPPPPDLWFGMITDKDDRWITANPAEANEAAIKKRCSIAQVFHTMVDAEAWLEEVLPALIPRTQSEKAAFRHQGNLIQHFLYQRHYSGTYIREYVRSGLLALIAARSFRSFFDLGDAIRQLAYDYPQWDGGPAKAMLKFHADKLVDIRNFAVSRKQLVLQVYTYLRDARGKDFYHESMTGALLERIGDLSLPPNAGGSTGDSGAGVTQCGWCNQRELHRLFDIPGQRQVCPVKDLTDKAKPKEAGKWIVDQKHATPSKDIQELLASALTQFV